MGNRPSAPSADLEKELTSNIDKNCALAAKAIAEADIFLLCTGAGFSADSGLAIYADVAKVEAYAKLNLEYHDICQPHWLEKSPDLFWGFWGQCFNDYRNTAPHEGYQIINKWVDRKFRTSEVAESIRTLIADQEVCDNPASSGEEPSGEEPYRVNSHAGAFFVFTSNVDAHHFDWFRACEIRECHGNTEIYQCAHSRKTGCKGVWRAPMDYSFVVDKTTMLAPEDPDTAKPDVSETKPNSDEVPRIGQVKGGGRESMLRYMPGLPSGRTESGFSGGHPKCKTCGGPARPAILMFGDGGWIDVKSQYQRFENWSEAVSSYITKKTEAARQADIIERVKVAILEIGAGGNVTTVRCTSEDQAETFRKAGADVSLIRINPDLPLGDCDELKPGGTCENEMISIMLRGLECIRKIDAAMA